MINHCDVGLHLRRDTSVYAKRLFQLLIVIAKHLHITFSSIHDQFREKYLFLCVNSVSCNSTEFISPNSFPVNYLESCIYKTLSLCE